MSKLWIPGKMSLHQSIQNIFLQIGSEYSFRIALCLILPSFVFRNRIMFSLAKTPLHHLTGINWEQLELTKSYIIITLLIHYLHCIALLILPNLYHLTFFYRLTPYQSLHNNTLLIITFFYLHCIAFLLLPNLHYFFMLLKCIIFKFTNRTYVTTEIIFDLQITQNIKGNINIPSLIKCL